LQLDAAKQKDKGKTVSKQMDEYDTLVAEEHQYKAKLF
jgi:hypothetical protein